MSFLLRVAMRAIDPNAGMLMPKGLGALRTVEADPPETEPVSEAAAAGEDGASRLLRRATGTVTDDAEDNGDGEQPIADAEGNEVRPLRRAMVPAPEDESDGSPQAARLAWRAQAEPEEDDQSPAPSAAHRLAPAAGDPIEQPEEYPEATANARAPGKMMAMRASRATAAAAPAGVAGVTAGQVATPIDLSGVPGSDFDAWRPDFAAVIDGAAIDGSDETYGGTTAQGRTAPTPTDILAPGRTPSISQQTTVIEQIDVFVSEPAPAAQRPRLADPAALLAARYVGTF